MRRGQVGVDGVERAVAARVEQAVEHGNGVWRDGGANAVGRAPAFRALAEKGDHAELGFVII